MRTQLIYVLICAACWTASNAQAGVVRITSINDAYDPNHAAEVDVQPGDLVNLSADILDDDNNFQAEGASVESFVWSADDSVNGQSDVCNVASSSDCLSQSNFQASDYGVSFYVPYDMGQQIVISVSNSDSDSTDTIVLKNLVYQPNYTPPTQVVSDPSLYTSPTLNPDDALAGQGRWVAISGNRYWVPYTYIANGDSDWAPYRNGYWTFDAERGHTWVSYDPWGWMTDHYGVWRQHAVYGWMWMPFDDLHYEPHTVTWFDDQQSGYVGWYPYFPNFSRAYRDGAEVGFVDGYWNNYECANGFGRPDYGWRPGYTIVRYGSFQNDNIVNVYERNIYENQIVIGVVGRAYGQNRFARFPGVASNFNDGRAYLEGRGGIVQETHVGNFGNNGQIMGPQPIRPVPAIYQQIGKANGFNRPSPIGAVVDARGNQGPVMIPPTSNGRGIVAPPRVTDSQGHSQPIPPQSQRPAEPNHNNPIASRPTVPQQQQPNPVKPALPVYDPNKPTPPPVNNHPQPAPAPHPQPAPAPHPQPAPRPQPAPQPQPAPKPGPHPR